MLQFLLYVFAADYYLTGIIPLYLHFIYDYQCWNLQLLLLSSYARISMHISSVNAKGCTSINKSTRDLTLDAI